MRQIPRRWMSVDPGLGGTGYACWLFTRKTPTHTGILSCRSDTLTWQKRAKRIVDEFRMLLVDPATRPDCVYYEEPSFFQSNVGMAAAKRGDLAKLFFVVGMLAGACHEAAISCIPIPVQTWLGQMPTPVVRHRVKTFTGQTYTSHALYAVGLGVHILKESANE